MKIHKTAAKCVRVKRLSYVVLASCLLLLPGTQRSLASTRKEQTTFYSDPSEPLIEPIAVPDAVLQILAKDAAVMACLKDNAIPRGESLASWFTASEVHLNAPDETDIVVLPASTQGESYMCFRYVEGIEWFWVFRHTEGHFQLVLKTAGLSLSVLDARHNGYRDIRSDGLVGKFATTVTFRFEGGRYLQYRKKTSEIR
jgi:hypothetical protein